MEIIAIAIVSLAAGYVIGMLVARSKKQSVASQLQVMQAQIDNEKQQAKALLDNLRQQLEDAKTEGERRETAAKNDAEANCAKIIAEKERAYHEALEAKQKSCDDAIAAQDKRHTEAMAAQEARHSEALRAMKANFDETMAKVTAQVRTATDDMLRQRQKEFSESSNTNLGQIVTPLRETIDKMRQAMDDSTIKQTAMSHEMKGTIESMIRQSEAARKSADDLAHALKHGSKVQGDWGETVLDEILESQGLTRGVHYDTQVTMRDAAGNVIKSEEGAAMRPDVIMHLDQRREVIIDSKVSLTAFFDYVNADDEETRAACLKAHVDSLQKHVKELSAKDYSSYVRPPKVRMDYVIMFVPNTGALWTALNAQPDLWRRAMEKNVFIADEQTLFAALRIINLTWTQIAQAQNHEKVYELANEMLDRVGQFVKKYEAVGKALDSASKAYEEGKRKLVPGGQSILRTCAKLEKLGAKQSDKNPLPQLLDIDDIPALEEQTTPDEQASTPDEPQPSTPDEPQADEDK